MEQGIQGRCTGMTLRDEMGREVGGGFRMGNPWLIDVNVWQKSLQYCKVISLQLNKFSKKRICLLCGRPGFNSWVGKIPWRRAWQPTPVCLPGEFPWTEEPGGLQIMGSQRFGHSQTWYIFGVF